MAAIRETTVREISRSHPALDGFRGIGRRRVEADLRAGRESMHDIQQLLEQAQIVRVAQTGADHHAVEGALAQMVGEHALGSLAQIDKAILHFIALRPNAVHLRVEVCPNDRGAVAAHGLGIDERGVQAQSEHCRHVQLHLDGSGRVYSRCPLPWGSSHAKNTTGATQRADGTARDLLTVSYTHLTLPTSDLV